MSGDGKATLRQQILTALEQLAESERAFEAEMEEAKANFASEMAKARQDFAEGVTQARADFQKALRDLG